jgi:transposase
MMGMHDAQPELFSYRVDLDKPVHAQHPLRRVLALVDFNLARAAGAHTYGDNAHGSVDPAVLLKLIFLLFQESVRSERELMRRLPERLDWLWFLGYGLDDKIPDHSVLSKAHVDGSLIDADASRDSVIKADAETVARIKAAHATRRTVWSTTAVE